MVWLDIRYWWRCDFNCVVLALCDLTFVQSDTFLRHCHSLHWAQKWRHFDTAAAAATKFLDFLQISALAMWAAAVPPIVPADHPMAGITLLECTTARPICVHRTMVCSPTSCLSRTLCVGSAASGVALQSIGCVCAVLQFCVLPQSVCLGSSPLCYTAPALGKV